MLTDRIPFTKVTLSNLVKIAFPMMVSQGAFAVMIFTDRYFMSQISPAHMAAALGGGVAVFFSVCFFLGVLSYGNALSAQYLGAGKKAKCSRVVTQGLLLAVLCQPLLIVITFSVAGIFAAMGHEAAQVELERRYYLILMLGSIFSLGKTCFASYFAGIQRTRIVMICDVMGMLLNIPLSYVMVFGKLGFPALGIVGAAVSTVASSAFALALYGFVYVRKLNRVEFNVADSWHFDRAIVKRYLRLGLPSGMELFLNVAAFNLFLLMFQSYGVVQGAAAAIVFNWDILSFVPMIGLNIGIVSMIGRSVGANDMSKANEVISAAFLLGLSYSAALAIIYISFRFTLVDVFAPPAGDFAEIRVLAGFMMVGLSSYAMADATIQIVGGVLRGAGDTRWVMIASTILHWVMLVVQYFIIRVYELGPKVAWIAFVFLILSIAAVFLARLIQGRWRDPEVLKQVMAER